MERISADLVIVGGGVIGASIAFHLAEAGVDVALIERSEVGAGSTSKAAGGLRTIFSDPLNLQIAKRSLELFEDFGRRPGFDIDFKRPGYLILISNEEDQKVFQEISRLQNSFGIPSRMLSPEEAKRINPLISLDGIIGAIHSPTDAQCSPEGVASGYAQAARRHGARVILGQTVDSIEVKDGEIRRVNSSDFSITTKGVVISAGVWSPAIGSMLGISIPVLPYKREIIITESLGQRWESLPREMPMTIDFTTTLSWRPEGDSLLMGFSDETVPAGFNTERDARYIEKLAELALHRIPVMEDLGIGKGWAGLYDTSPDNNCILGEYQSISRLLYATGFSGHGVMQAPAVGEIIRDLFLKRAPFVDITPLSLNRFSDSPDLRVESAVF